MNKTIVAAGLAAGLAAGGAAGFALGVPGGAGAQTPDTTVPESTAPAEESTAPAEDATPEEGESARGAWMTEALAPLVEEGTITQAQADAVIAALQEAKPERGGPGGGFGMRGGAQLEAVATAIGISEDDLRTALRDGQTIAEVAQANGVAVDTVVAAMVESFQTHLAEHVAAGEITQEEADARLAEATERFTAVVNGEGGFGGPGSGGPGFGGRGPRGDADGTAEEDSAD
jgi:hypothetical protein